MRNEPQQNGYYEERPQSTTIWVPNNPSIEAYRQAKASSNQGYGYGRQPNYGQGNYGGYNQQPNPYQRPQQQYQQQRQPRGQQQQYNNAPAKQKKPKPFYTYQARKPILWIIAIFMLLAVVVNVLPIFVGAVGEYTSPFVRRSTGLSDKIGEQLQYTSLADPVMSLVTFITKGTPKEGVEIVEDNKALISQRFYYDCLSQMDTYKPDTEKGVEGDIVKVIAYYALPIIVVLFAVLTIYMFLKTLSAAVSGKKRKLAYSLFLGILYLVAIAILTAIWNNLGMSEIGKVFLTPINLLTKGDKLASGDVASIASVGLGFYITVVLYLLSWILNFFAYKSTKHMPNEY